MQYEFQSLISKLSNLKNTSNVIEWSSPVPFFGDCSHATVATVGINPSNREFVCAKGMELEDAARRFHTLRSLGIRSWEDADMIHARMVEKACEDYFSINPYDSWFRRIDRVINGTNCSFYNNRACHIDLVPFATSRKWALLETLERESLLLSSSEEMKSIVSRSKVRILVLNGATVVERISRLYKIDWEIELKQEWNLARRNGKHVQGISYRGLLEVGEGRKRRKILLLGFNHNIQSSFGVTTLVIESIRDWITTSAREHSRGKMF